MGLPNENFKRKELNGASRNSLCRKRKIGRLLSTANIPAALGP
jgi:hypothetical protein